MTKAYFFTNEAKLNRLESNKQFVISLYIDTKRSSFEEANITYGKVTVKERSEEKKI